MNLWRIFRSWWIGFFGRMLFNQGYGYLSWHWHARYEWVRRGWRTYEAVRHPVRTAYWKLYMIPRMRLNFDKHKEEWKHRN